MKYLGIYIICPNGMLLCKLQTYRIHSQNLPKVMLLENPRIPLHRICPAQGFLFNFEVLKVWPKNSKYLAKNFEFTLL